MMNTFRRVAAYIGEVRIHLHSYEASNDCMMITHLLFIVSGKIHFI